MSDEFTKLDNSTIINPNKNVPFICKQCRPSSLIRVQTVCLQDFPLKYKKKN